jgi:hypothetical protein
VEKLGVRSGSPAYHAVTAAIRALASTDLPGKGDYETSFAPGRAHVRRIAGTNLWVLYRFDEGHVFIMTARDEPPVPVSG